MDKTLRTTLADAVAFLTDRLVPYALIGGLAVSLRGQARVTVDVDMLIAVDLDRALRLIPDLEGSSFMPLFDDVSQVVQTSFILPLRHRLTKVKVDFAIGLSQFEQQAVSRAQPLDVGGTLARVALAEDLLIMKALAGRPRDDQDIQGLIAAQGSRLDWNYCLKLATDLGQDIDQDLAGRLREFRRSADK